MERQPTEVAGKPTELMMIQDKWKNEDDIHVWGFSKWVVVSRTGMKNAMWNTFSGKNKKFCFAYVGFEISIKYPGQV